jgi:hypothetical protein
MRAGRQGALRRYRIAFQVQAGDQGLGQGQCDERSNFRQETAVAFIASAALPGHRYRHPSK